MDFQKELIFPRGFSCLSSQKAVRSIYPADHRFHCGHSTIALQVGCGSKLHNFIAIAFLFLTIFDNKSLGQEESVILEEAEETP